MSSNEECRVREFGFSEAAIRRGRQALLVLLVCLIPSGLVFTLFCPGFEIKKSLTAVGISGCWAGVIVAVQALLISRRQRRLRVFVYEDKLVRQSGKKQQILLWEDIEKVKVVENKNGDVVHISLSAQKPKPAMYFGGFAKMKDLARLVTENAPEGILLRRKRWRLDWQNPLIVALIVIPPTLIAVCAVASMGSKAMDIFAIVVAFALGAGLLVFRPFTKYDASSKWFELLVAVALLVMSTYGCICFAQTGRLP